MQETMSTNTTGSISS